jgi:signal transduction histidine kinase
VVSDSGIGFDGEEARHLFKPVSRGDRARNHFANGLGIGLHLAREIVPLTEGTSRRKALSRPWKPL